MNQKTVAKDELILENSLFIDINGMNVSYPLQVVIAYADMVVCMSPHEESDDRVRGLGIQVMLTQVQIEQLITFWNEWRDANQARGIVM